MAENNHDPNILEDGDHRIKTIERFIFEQQKLYPQATGTFTRMLQDIALAAKIIARKTTRAGLTDILGETEDENVFGERQQRLDIFADRTMYEMNNFTERVCAMASEEHEDILDIPPHYGKGNYVLLFDPLDGSSNIDVNAAIGTIFSIHRKYTRGETGTVDDFLQEGKRLVAAGYVIYGSSTMMVYTTGQGVHGFTLDPGIGEFLLSHPNMTFPDEAKYYNVNQGNEKEWTNGTKRYIKYLQGIEGEGRPALSHRYSGAMVSDFHRNLLKGGIYIYPGELPGKEHAFGKIRLMFEAQCLAFVAEQAGGYASDGLGDILDIQPHSLHQTLPVFIGNEETVKKAEEYIQKYDQDWIEEYQPYRNGETKSEVEKRAEEARKNNEKNQ